MVNALRERQLRVGSGLVLAAYVVPHLINHALGVFSIELMDGFRELYAPAWRSLPGSLLLLAAFGIHFVLTLLALYRRSHLRMRASEAVRVVMGLLIVPMAAGHVVWARLYESFFDVPTYAAMLVAVEQAGPAPIVWFVVFIIIVWVHLAIGLHYWLRAYPGYRRWVPTGIALATLLPTLATLGFVRGLMFAGQAPLDPAIDPSRPEYGELGEAVESGSGIVWGAFLLIVVGVLVARSLRERLRRRKGVVHLTVVDGRRLSAPIGRTVLEALQLGKVGVASVCGGRGRCTTCRITVHAGGESLDAPTGLEREALARIGALAQVRLACQIRPSEDLTIEPMLPATVTVRDALRRGGVQGREQPVVIMFLDLRGSTRLAETRMPYDVLFILNQFFSEMSEALAETGGHYAQFSGDGLMALYGTRGSLTDGAGAALAGARRMHERLDDLNERLSAELDEPLRMGVGLHTGDAIVGTMGPPESPNFSAIGDNVNVAARLEALTKDTGCALIISRAAAEASGRVFDGFEPEDAEIRGRDEPISIYRIGSAAEIPGG
jgi:adenylate cyclase